MFWLLGYVHRFDTHPIDRQSIDRLDEPVSAMGVKTAIAVVTKVSVMERRANLILS